MFKTATLPEHRNPLNTPVKCSNCGALMTLIGANYVCPNNDDPGTDRCPTTPVDAEKLTVQVATQVLTRIMNDSTVAVLTADIQQITSGSSSAQEERLQGTESVIREVDEFKERILQPVEQELATYREVAEQVHRLNSLRMGLAYESQIAQEEIDKLAFIGDTEGLEKDARDIAEHLQDAGPEETTGLLNIFVQEIRVGPGSAEIIYTHPLPDEHNHPKVASDQIPLVS